MHNVQTQSVVSYVLGICYQIGGEKNSFPWSMVVCMLRIFVLQDKKK